MCGRFTLRTRMETIADLFASLPPAEWEPRYNIAPSQTIKAVRANEKGTWEWADLQWGLIPHWADDPKIGYRMINARGETAAEKPSFRSAFKRRRCLIAADGFYEWKKENKKKQPMYVHLADDRPFFFAGLWEANDKMGTPVESCTIITTNSNELLAPLHDRMPVILNPEHFDSWLDPEFSDRETLKSYLQPWPSEDMEYYPVSSAVNKPSHQGPDCIQPLEEQGELFE